jgi:hypothetical protein
MTIEAYIRIPAARYTRVVLHRPPSEIGGRREDRVQAAPMAPVRIKKHGEGTTGLAERPAFPAQCFTAYFALFSGAGLSCPRRLADRNRKTWHQRRGVRTTRLRRPRSCRSSSACARPPHPALDVRDDAYAPRKESGTAGRMLLIWGRSQAIFYKSENARCDKLARRENQSARGKRVKRGRRHSGGATSPETVASLHLPR